MAIHYKETRGIRLNTNWSSDLLTTDLISSISIQGVIRSGSTAHGTFTLLCSNNNVDWEAMSSSGGTAISKAVTTNDTFFWDILGTAAKYLMIRYVSSSGDGYLDLWINSKGAI